MCVLALSVWTGLVPSHSTANPPILPLWSPTSAPSPPLVSVPVVGALQINYKQLFALQTGRIPDNSLHEQLFPGRVVSRGAVFFFFFFFPLLPASPPSLSNRSGRTAVVTHDSVKIMTWRFICLFCLLIFCAEQKQQSRFSAVNRACVAYCLSSS